MLLKYLVECYNYTSRRPKFYVVALELLRTHIYLVILTMPGNLNLKKSWNPGLVKNQKKVWEEEQRVLNEHLKSKARDEVLKKEREQQDLIRLQYQDSESMPTDVKKKLSNLSWMYDDANLSNTNDGFNEIDSEFLLGKNKVEAMLKGGNYIDTSQRSRMQDVIDRKDQNKDGELAQKPHTKLDGDPLLKILNERKKHAKVTKDKEKAHGRRGHKGASSAYSVDKINHRRNKDKSRSNRAEKENTNMAPRRTEEKASSRPSIKYTDY